MSTSIILLDQNFNANDVDIMEFEPCVLFPPAAVWGGELIKCSRSRHFHSLLSDDVFYYISTCTHLVHYM